MNNALIWTTMAAVAAVGIGIAMALSPKKTTTTTTPPVSNQPPIVPGQDVAIGPGPYGAVGSTSGDVVYVGTHRYGRV